MALRKLLIITYHFPPSAGSGTYRMLGFARHLPRFGWQPVIVAPPQMPLEPKDKDLLNEVPPETVVYYTPFPKLASWRAVRALLKFFGPYEAWLSPALVACAQVIREHHPEGLLTSSPPHCVHILGLLLQRRYHLRWVADFRDPWMAGGDPQQVPLFRRSVHSYLEKRVIKSANAIVTNAPLAREQLQEAYPAYQQKISFITNGFEPGLFASLPPKNASNKSAIRIVHAGELYDGRDPRPFLDAIRDLPCHSSTGRWEVSFLGRLGSDNFNLATEIRDRHLDSTVEIKGQLPYAEAIRVMVDSDILLVIDRPRRTIGVPAKLYEYLGSGQPVLALAEPVGDLAWVLRQSGVPHRIASPTDPGQIRKALLELVDQVSLSASTATSRDRLMQFTRESMTQRLATILDNGARR